MAQPDQQDNRSSSLQLLAAIAIVVAALYFAKSVLMPLALAVLLSFLLAPLVKRLERLGLHRILAVLLTASLTFLLFATLGWIIWGQLADLAGNLPKYQDNIHAKIESLRSSTGGIVGRASRFVGQLSQDLSVTATQPAGPQGTLAANPLAGAAGLEPASTSRPIRVEVIDPPPTPVQFLRNTVGPIIGPLGTAGLVIVFVIFILFQREDLRDRLIRLVSHGQLNVTTQALDDAASRVSRYLLMQLIVNVTYGIPIAIGLLLIGVPNAILWGLLATLLRFIPYIGPWLGAAGPIFLSLAVAEGWTMPILTVSLYITIELISNNVVEPLLYGSSTGISTIAVLVAAVFWTWLWGIPGLLLATPMTVVLVVAGKYVPQLHFLNILLGDEPVLEPKTRVYQRLLAWDAEEAGELVEEFLEGKSLVQLYDEVLIPALGMAEEDHHRGALDEHRLRFVHESLKEIMDDLADRQNLPAAKASEMPIASQEVSGKREEPHAAGTCVLCLPAHDEADEIVAMMLAQVLQMRGCRARYIAQPALASEMVETAAQRHAKVVCISAMPPAAAAHVRYLCKRLQARLGNATFIIGLWAARGDLNRIKDRLRCGAGDQVIRTLAEAIEQITPLLQNLTAQADAKVTAPAPA